MLLSLLNVQTHLRVYIIHLDPVQAYLAQSVKFHYKKIRPIYYGLWIDI